MAIKTISQLNQYDNGNQTERANMLIGGTMRMYASNNSTDDETVKPTTNPYDSGQCKAPELAMNSNGYFGSFFEVSKPLNKGTASITSNNTYETYKITYEDLARNIIYDTKQYLNTRNYLMNFNLDAICNGKYTYNGNKTFTGTMDVTGYVHTKSNLTVDGNTIIFTSTNNNASFTCKPKAEFKKAVDITGNTTIGGTLDVSNKLTVKSNGASLTGNVNIDNGNLTVDSDNTIFATYLTGGCHFLMDSHNAYTNTSLASTENTAEGDPVYFKDGRPVGISCVNYARNAYNIVDSGGQKYSVGDSKHAIWLNNGVFERIEVVSCADYANYAYWSDLGEKYIGDETYEPGTLVQFGGEKEITIAKTSANAVVSTKAFELNAGLENGTVIALCGRVPTKIVGKIDRFQKVVLSNTLGVGRAKKWYEFWKKTIGISLEQNTNEGVKLVECVVRLSF